MADEISVENREGNDIWLSHRHGKHDAVGPLFAKTEPAFIMLLLRKTRRKLNDAVVATPITDTETLMGLAKTVCAIAETTARYAQVPTAPKPRALSAGDKARPVFDLAKIADA